MATTMHAPSSCCHRGIPCRTHTVSFRSHHMPSLQLCRPLSRPALSQPAPVTRPCRSSRLVARAVLPGSEQIVSHLASSSTVAHASSALLTVAHQASNLLYLLADAADAVADPGVSDAVAKNNGGFFGPITVAFEAFLKILDSGLDRLHVPYSYGFSIILLTFLVKLATYPLSKKQVESTMAMQVLQPRVKAIQDKFKNDQERMQIEVAQLYKEAGVNPLAGCLPVLVTLPVWIGLYRALSNVADEGLLKEGFFWIPSLAGPTSLAARNAGGGFSWLFPFENGAPPIGWHDAIAYLVLPVLLIVSQFLSQKIISPPQSQDPSQQQTNAILKFLPFMIGWFSLNVPSGLTLYWFTNNLLTTGQQVWLKRGYQPIVAGGPNASGTVVNAPVEEKIQRITGKDIGARRSNNTGDVIDVTSERGSDGGQTRGERFRALKAREAARKAQRAVTAAAASTGGASAADGAMAAASVAVATQQAVQAEIENGEHAEEDYDGAEEEEAAEHSSNESTGARKNSRKKKAKK